MKNKFLLTSLLFSSLMPMTSVQAKEKIVGGEKVTDPNEVTYMVSLSGSCGGSIIGTKWVLTAAHCVGYFSTVKGGVLNLRETGHSYKVKNVTRHPRYDYNTFSNDFAVVELEQEIDFAATGLKKITLADAQFAAEGNQEPGLDSTVYGFGNLASNQGNTTKDLNKVVVPIVSLEDANREEAYDGEIDETMIPAGYATGGKDSCQGDSGGPLVVFNQHNEPVQIGVVSWGEGCAKENKYGIYSRVSSAYEWIQQMISAK